ncbi:hypothetical protein GCM10022408_16060 [Hymenobacter fastidiosus]|uniref:Uncharacterized protein n=1 Tax=Hymenobacter fastidiosus TaxID=486264 RepID=A0ABP7S0T3_9BACT
MLEIIRRHQAALATAIKALHNRTFYVAFSENSAPEIYGADADQLGRAAFDAP